MPENSQSLAAKHHAFYEVLPYYVVVDEGQENAPTTTRRVQSGYEVNIYGVSTRKELAPPTPDSDYAQGYTEVQKIADEISHAAGRQCSIEVIPFASSAFLDAQDQRKVEARIQIRISHLGPLEEPAGQPEQDALKEVESRLEAVGIARR